MIELSANLGFLWSELPLTSAILRAKACGFHAVECHWPYDVNSAEVVEVLQETELTMLGINTRRGNSEAGEMGVTAIPGRESEARDYIEEAISYAVDIGCGKIHAMAGITHGRDEADTTFRENLLFAAEQATQHSITILIEPINQRDAPGYHLSTIEHSIDLVREIGKSNLKVMFDCYHLQIMQGDLLRRFVQYQSDIGHIQFAAVPDRGEPDQGELNYVWLLNSFVQSGWNAPIGAEYKPRTSTDDGLNWMQSFR